MFAGCFFPSRYFADRYFPKVGVDPDSGPAVPWIPRRRPDGWTAPARPDTWTPRRRPDGWTAPGPMSDITCPQTHYQEPGESILRSADFAPLLQDGEALSSVTSITVSPTGPTIGSGTIVDTLVKFRVSGVTADQTYTFKVKAATDAGNTRVVTCTLVGASS